MRDSLREIESSALLLFVRSGSLPKSRLNKNKKNDAFFWEGVCSFDLNSSDSKLFFVCD